MNRTIRRFVLTAFVMLPSVAVCAQAPARPAPGVAPPPPVPAQTLPAGWEAIDQRLVFFTVQLASVETSIDAVNKSLRVAGYRQAVRQGEASRAQRGNELMDRNAGGPVNWRDFYGQTAERFFYRPTLEITATKFDKQALKRTSPDELSQLNLPGPASQRPPQFDYIYRANNDAQKRAAADAAALGGKISALLDRRRQLEAEQASTWAKISLQAVASRRFASRPLFRFEVKSAAAPAGGGLAAQRAGAARAASAHVRTLLRACADAQDVVGDDPRATFDTLRDVVAGSTREMTDGIARHPELSADAGDTGTTLGKVVASAERLADVTKNVADAYANAADRDGAGDDAQKQTFRAFLQQSLFDCAANVATTAELVSALGREWKVQPDVDRPATATTAPSAFAGVKKAAVAAGGPPATGESAADAADEPGAEEAAGDMPAPPDGAAPRRKGVVNLLPLINPQEDTVDGKWQVVDGVLRSGGQGQERIETPYEPPEEYDYEIEFTKRQAKGIPIQILSRGGKPFIWVMGDGNTYTFHYLKGSGDFSNKTTTQYRRLEKDKRYKSLVKVRRDGAKAYLNGKLVGAWETDFSDQLVKPFWALRNHSALGVGAGDCEIEFHVIRVTEISGPGETLRDPPAKPGEAAAPAAGAPR